MIKNPLHEIQPEPTTLNGIYRGVVEDNSSDPKKAGRIKVRIFGVHTELKTKSADGTEGIPTNELPWAEPALGLFEGAVSGFGAWTVPLQGSHLFLFFENGNPMQPRYFASAPGITSEKPDTKKGFNDPDGEYPKSRRVGEPDWHRLGRGKTEQTHIIDKNANLKKNVLKADDESWDEPESAYKAEYPNNNVLVSHKGFTVEVDSTDHKNRFHIYHPSRSYIEIDNDGNIVIRNDKNKFEIVKEGEKNTYIHLNNNVTIGVDNTKLVKGKETMEVRKDQNETVKQNRKAWILQDDNLTVTGDSKIYINSDSDISIEKARNVWSGQTVNIDAPTVNINSGLAFKTTPVKPKE